MKKIKKVLLLLIAFSFTLLMFNSQAYAIEYYEFTFEITDVTDRNDVQYTPLDLYDSLSDFTFKFGDEVSPNTFEYQYDNFIITYRPLLNYIELSIDIETLEINSSYVMVDTESGDGFTVGIYTLTTDVPITFIGSWWDNIINAIDEAATALSSAASAGFGLIYDGVGLTALGSALVIPIGLGLVLGVFYLIIRMLPSVRL